MKPVRALFGACVLAGAAAALPGCLALAVGAAAGVGTYAYVEGELKTMFDSNLDRTWDATRAAIDDLQFRVEESTKDALGARLVAREADGKTVKINEEAKGGNLTEVRVRVGTFGDEAQSRLILDKIKARL